jgi:hypothetical protein
MSILNRPSDGLLSVLLALRRALIAYGAQPYDDLVELVAPASVTTPEMAKHTLTRWTQLGFFSESDGKIRLSDAVSTISLEDLDGLRAAVLRIILLPDNNAELLSGEAEDSERSRAVDCTRALAWSLAQDPYAFPSSYDDGEKLQNHQGVAPKLFVNSTRWNGFVEWAVFMGAAWRTSRTVVPSPTFALRSILGDVFQGSTELSEHDFFWRLPAILPVLDGGTYRTTVEGQIARPWRKLLDHEVSPSLSAALLTLEHEGALRLEARSDAPVRRLLGPEGAESRSVSHVVRLGVA